MSKLAAEILQRSSGASPAGVMRRITASLEALSAYGTLQGAPRAGRLVEDVDPPGFDALAALVPRLGDDSRAASPSKVLAFQKEAKVPAKGKTRGGDRQAEGGTATRSTGRSASREAGGLPRCRLSQTRRAARAGRAQEGGDAREGNRRHDGCDGSAPAESCLAGSRGPTEGTTCGGRSRIGSAGRPRKPNARWRGRRGSWPNSVSGRQ